MRIKNMSRFITSMVIIFIIIVSIWSMISKKVFSYEEEKYTNIIVSKGDTLWSIAKNYKGNINENIYNIKKLNNLETSGLYVGQELIIPLAD